MKKNQNTRQKTGKLSDALIKELPKIELHRHLEGSFRMDTLLELGKKRGLQELPLNDREAFRQLVQMTPDDTPDFLTFLSKFRADWYSTLEDPKRLAYEAVEDAAGENILYYEMRFSPEHFCRKSGFQIEEAMEAVIEGATKAADENNMQVAFLITLGREKLTPDEMLEYIDRCLPFKKHGVVGFDLAGDELNYPPELFTKVFRGLFDRTGLHATIHAGEACGAENVRTSIMDLEAVRIGHGFRSVEDPAVVDLLIEKQAMLEICLTSNLQTGTVSNIEKHPFRQLYSKGVAVTLNSDDPQIQQSDLNTDYMIARDTFGFRLEDFLKVNKTSIKSIFQDDTFKKNLLKSYTALFEECARKA